MSTPRIGTRYVPGFQTNTGPDTSKRLPCPEYDADPSSSTVPERCKAWSGSGIADVTRHLRTHHADCHELIDRLSSSKLQPDARYQMYHSFFTSPGSCEELYAKSPDFRMESQRSAQGQAHLPRNHQDNNPFDGLTQYRHQPGIQSHQGGSLPPQQISRDTMVNHSRSEPSVRSTNAAPLNTDGPYKHAPETNDHLFVPLNDPSFTTGLSAHANAPCSLGSNKSMVIPSTAPNHQPQAWSNQPEGITYSNRDLTFDIEQPSEMYSWSNGPYNTGAFGEPLSGVYQTTTNTITAQPMRQNLMVQIPHALINQYCGQLSSSTTLNCSLQTREPSEVCCCRCHLAEHQSVSCFVCQVFWKKARCDCEGRKICCKCQSSALPVAPQIQRSRSYGADERNPA